MSGAAAPPGPDGIVVVDKEAGWTSHDVVARCRKILSQRKAGHAGTLDPGATGVLLVGLGRATRLLRYLTALEKTYRAEVVFGSTTRSDDDAGEVVARYDMASLSLDEVQAAADKLTGPIDQIPPMVSAIKIAGERLHKLSRQGRVVDRAARRVTVHSFVVGLCQAPAGDMGAGEQAFAVEVRCSSGTYVRALARDLGTMLGGGAHLRNLRRTRIGSFDARDAATLAVLSQDRILSPALAMRDYPRALPGDAVCEELAHGRYVARTSLGPVAGDGPWAVVDDAGRLVAMCSPRPDGHVGPDVVVAPAGGHPRHDR